MQFTPQQRMIINFGLAILGAIVAGGPSLFPDYIPPGAAKDIIQTCGLLLAIVSPIVGGTMSALSSNNRGPLAPADPPSIAAAHAVADLKPEDSPNKVAAVKAAAVDAVMSRDPKAGPA
jgi:hypothetical protein